MIVSDGGAIRRFAFPVAALCCGTLAAWIAAAHPLSPALAASLAGVIGLATGLRPQVVLCWLPAILPVAGLAPWTGWLVVEEFDLLVCAAAAGAYAAIAVGAWRDGDRIPVRRPLSRATIALFTVLAVGMSWSILARADLSQGAAHLAYRGYLDPLNALRVGKSLLLALLVVPLVQHALRQDPSEAGRLVSAGMIAGLAAGALAVVWERLAFTGLTDFSTDYRATALFWEMHVGGAALDGFLALTVPFAVHALMSARKVSRWGMCAIVAGLAGYACLVTFSRGVYVGVPVAIAATAWLALRRGRPHEATLRGGWWGWFILAIAAGVGAAIAFRHGGYRALAAVVATGLLMLPIAPSARRLTGGAMVTGVGAGILCGTAGGIVVQLLPKGVYAAFAVACAATLYMARRAADGQSRGMDIGAVACWSLLAPGCAWIAFHWGGGAALRDVVAVLVVVLGLFLWASRASVPLWGNAWRSHAAIGAMVLGVSALAAVFGGGAYMRDRFGSSEADFGGRLSHWGESLGLLKHGTDWLAGIGPGRFPAAFFFDARDSMFPGAYRVDSEGENRFLVLSGPRFMADRREWLKVSQRIAPAAGTYLVSMKARSAREGVLHVEICEQHLLYSRGCAVASLVVGKANGAWEQIESRLDGRDLSSGRWHAPRLGFFSVAAVTRGQRIDVDDLRVIGPSGQVLLNGDFSEGLARWFPLSEAIHLPWHAKNLFLHVLIEHGMIGLGLLVVALGAALWRSALGRSADHPVAPPLAGALAGFLVVGLFDSLLDVPRVAFLFYLCVFLALLIRPVRRASSGGAANAAPPGAGGEATGLP
ncbi:MAG: hypothetical protein JNM90_10930 [Burkholderiales bacterium]|nr:hypothetical protein [Burkholderiales bacterium]